MAWRWWKTVYLLHEACLREKIRFFLSRQRNILKYQNVKLVTILKDYITVTIWGKMGETKIEREYGEGIPMPAKMHHGK